MQKAAPKIYVDGDGCPVKDEIYSVARRYDLHVFMVCNSPLRIPKSSSIEPVVVGSHFDAVDDWIVEHVGANDIVVTNDLLLADRCIKKSTHVIDPRGKILDEDNIGEALANRELMTHLRQSGEIFGGPKPKAPRHRSSFLSSLDELINKAKRA